jgi:hypothetical protein
MKHDSEREVAKHLDKLNIRWIHENPIFVYDQNDRPRVWTPDFYLPELGIYIEVCGSQNFDYQFRNEVYEQNSIPVVFIHWYKEKEKWKKYLRKRIQEIEKSRRCKVDDMIELLLSEKYVSSSIISPDKGREYQRMIHEKDRIEQRLRGKIGGGR